MGADLRLLNRLAVVCSLMAMASASGAASLAGAPAAMAATIGA